MPVLNGEPIFCTGTLYVGTATVHKYMYSTGLSSLYLKSFEYLKCISSVSVADPGCLSRIPDPTFFHPGSRIRTVSNPDPHQRISILTPKKAKKWFLSSKNYDPGCSSRIPDPDADFLPSRIPDPGVKKAPDPGSRIRIRNTVFSNL
jgi:hypothetical protein